MYDPNEQNDAPRPGMYTPSQWGSGAPPASGGGRKKRSSAILTGLALLLLAVFAIGMLAGWQVGTRNVPGTSSSSVVPTLGANSLEDVREAVVAKVRPTVVQLTVRTSQGGGLGSGVIIDKRGYIVTNNHVVKNANSVEVELFDGTNLPGKVVGTAPSDDLAVVQIDASKVKIAVATFGDSSKLQVGQDVLAIGNPLGITQTVTSGIISALGRNVSTDQNGNVLPDTIQTDAAINPGNSGGALVDLQGNLIGVPTLAAIDPEFRTPANGVGFAIPSNRVKFIVPQLIDQGHVVRSGRAALGIEGITVDSVVAQQNNLPVDHGVYVAHVTPNSAAAQAGIKEGDIIVQINDAAITSTSSLAEVLLGKSPGDSVTLRFYRGGQEQTVNIKLGELQV
ncbi:MAG TPA: trypsin-like peptidase domain-containing protein [Ktedonobacteraceae bacterium]|jgi:putative serine protease PepD|nr:trypsin-like peptidase domain-containing protein [Ktedonobacteraceae bacterium]